MPWVFDPQSGGTKVPAARQEQTRQRILDYAERHYKGKQTAPFEWALLRGFSVWAVCAGTVATRSQARRPAARWGPRPRRGGRMVQARRTVEGDRGTLALRSQENTLANLQQILGQAVSDENFHARGPGSVIQLT